MGLRRIIVLLIAVIAAGGTAMYARSWIEGQQTTIVAVAAPAPEEKHEVLVADLDLAAGTFVKPQHLRWQQWPTDDVPASYVLQRRAHEEEMVGAVVRSRIAIGEPVTDGGVVKPGERGFLAAVLNPGMRAVSVPITPTSSNSGLIFPGDRVDLILTQTLVPSEGEGRRHAAGQRDRAQEPPDHRDGRRDRRRRRGGQEQREGQDRHPRGHAGAGRDGRAVDRARQAVAEPAQPGRRRRGGRQPCRSPRRTASPGTGTSPGC